MITWAVSHMIDLAGGATTLSVSLKELCGGTAPHASAISQWKFRNSLPLKWAPPVVLLLARGGASVEELVMTADVPEPFDPLSDPDGEGP